jgi:hypothetical protein
MYCGLGVTKSQISRALLYYIEDFKHLQLLYRSIACAYALACQSESKPMSTSAAAASTPPPIQSSHTFSPSCTTHHNNTPTLPLQYPPVMSEGAENQDAQIAQLTSLTGLDPATVRTCISWWFRGALTNRRCRQSAT